MLNQFSVNEGSSSSGGAGSVTSVGLTAIAPLAITNSPITSSGVMGISLLPMDPTSSLTNFQIFDDLLNYQVGTMTGGFPYWGIQNSTGAIIGRGTLNAGESNRVGVNTVNAGSVNGAYALHMVSVQTQILGSAFHSWSTSAYFASLPTGTNNYEVTVGFRDNWPTSNNVVNLLLSASLTNWQAQTGKAGVFTQVDTGIAPVAGNWTNLRVEIVQGGSYAVFYIDGVIGATIGTNLPTTTVGPIDQERQLAGTSPANRRDWIYYKYVLGSNRGVF